VHPNSFAAVANPVNTLHNQTPFWGHFLLDKAKKYNNNNNNNNNNIAFCPKQVGVG
jgi:hypothetical protein